MNERKKEKREIGDREEGGRYEIKDGNENRENERHGGGGLEEIEKRLHGWLITSQLS